MQDNKSKRLIWADALRGLLIISVVLGHSLQYGDYNNRLSWNIIYSFHMAAFFVVSGYVSYKENYNLSSLKHKAVQLLLPFASWTILYTLIWSGDIHYLLDVILRPDNSYWFIYVLFVIISIFTFIYSKSLSSKFKIGGKVFDKKDLYLAIMIFVLIGLMVISEFRLFGFQFISYYFGFYIFGFWIRKYEVRMSALWTIVIGLCWFAMSLFWRMHSTPSFLQGITFIPDALLNYSYRYLTALTGSLFFLGLAMQCFNNSKSRIIQVLSFLGKISLGIYITHLFFGIPITSYYRNLLLSDTSIAFVLLDSITRIIVSIIIVYIIQHIPVVRLLLLGKK